jgi:putative hydrolase of the HAD superfamily
VIAGVVFDIDDTMFLERDYVRSGFDHVGLTIGRSPGEAENIARWLWHAFESGVRGDTFDQLLASFPYLAERASLQELVELYRGHQPNIVMVPGMTEVLDSLRELGLRLGALSDGPAISQRAKAVALRLERWLDPILLTGAFDHPAFAKPGTAGFQSISESWGLGGPSIAYVGDNPMKDFIGPHRLGWATIRLRIHGQLRYELEPESREQRPEHEVRSPDELLRLISLERTASTRTTLGS